MGEWSKNRLQSPLEYVFLLYEWLILETVSPLLIMENLESIDYQVLPSDAATVSA